MKPARGRSVRVVPTLIVLLVGLTPPAAARQGATVDQGAFRILRGGQPIGTDSFNIVRTGSGSEARTYADGHVRLATTEIRSIIETTPDGFSRYRSTVSGELPTEVNIRAGARVLVEISSPAGEQARELRARPNLVVLEGDVAHHYHFVATYFARTPPEPGATLPVITPRGDAIATLAVLSVADASLSIGGRTLPATRIRLALDGIERSLWTDASGRVLRLEVPSTGYVAERLQPPG